ncbi:thiamine ABC transporter substrate binding subunit [Chromatiales bacterium (ex Bugula neritina AB1)]|nr:thiamine ABC transporter substrate binding subunit [Chromatiales bacterium (ex Bugula neritina AB1)]
MLQITKYLTAALLLATSVALKAGDKPVLTIYTYDAFAADWGPAPGIEEAFETDCDCDVQFVAADSSIGALRKIQLEGNQTKADIILGLDTNIAEAARETGLFTTHGASTGALALPTGDWSDPTFLPFDYSYFSFVYNKDNVAAPPTSFQALVDMPDDFKIVIQDPRSSTPGLGLLLWIQQAYGDNAQEIWQGLAGKIVTVTKGWSDSYGLFLKDEADMVLSYTTSPAYHLIAEKDSRFAAAPFDEGHYLQIEVAAIVKTSQNQELARSFMQFMLSDTVQDIIPTTNWVYPATKTAKGLPTGFESLHLPEKSLLIDGVTVEENRSNWIEQWKETLGQ